MHDLIPRERTETYTITHLQGAGTACQITRRTGRSRGKHDDELSLSRCIARPISSLISWATYNYKTDQMSQRKVDLNANVLS
ncbi:hypothetical protein U9M48_037054, partial [Paspalum notatum var. saurae]